MNRRLAVVLASILAVVLLVALGPVPFLIGVATALLPLPLYVALALWLDRNEPEPRHLLLSAFTWGMLVASIVSLVMNAAAVAYVHYTLGLSALVGQRVGTLIASPVFEEIAKGTALFLLFHRERDEFDNVMDGAMYAAMVGLGFATTENVLYYGNALAHSRLAAVFAMRGLASPFAHPLFTAMTGIGFGWAREAPDRRRAFLRVAAGLSAAIALHVVWNVAASAHVFVPAYALIMVPTFVAVLFLLRYSLARERRIVREHVARSLGDALTPAELEALCGAAGLRGWWRRRAGGPGADEARALHRVRRAAAELGFACWHDARACLADSERARALQAVFTTELAVWRQTSTISARPGN